jgi:hypothetical protein
MKSATNKPVIGFRRIAEAIYLCDGNIYIINLGSVG